MARARFCGDRSDVVQLRCVDDQPESEHSFGNQLWYFEGVGVDEHERRAVDRDSEIIDLFAKCDSRPRTPIGITDGDIVGCGEYRDARGWIICTQSKVEV